MSRHAFPFDFSNHLVGGLAAEVGSVIKLKNCLR
jgi:hypothetical protein